MLPVRSDCSLKMSCLFHPGYGWPDSEIQPSSGRAMQSTQTAFAENTPASRCVAFAIQHADAVAAAAVRIAHAARFLLHTAHPGPRPGAPADARHSPGSVYARVPGYGNPTAIY